MTEDKNKMNQISPECSVPKDPEVDNPNKRDGVHLSSLQGVF